MTGISPKNNKYGTGALAKKAYKIYVYKVRGKPIDAWKDYELERTTKYKTLGELLNVLPTGSQVANIQDTNTRLKRVSLIFNSYDGYLDIYVEEEEDGFGDYVTIPLAGDPTVESPAIYGTKIEKIWNKIK